MSHVSFTFREEVRAGDPARVREIAESTGFFSAAEVDIAVELIEARLAKGPASGYHFLFADDPAGVALGYTCYGEIACTVGSYDLYWIIVHRDCRSRGLGRQLMARTEELVTGLGGRGLYVETAGRHQYHPTRSFYLKNGYAVIATLKDFYSPGDDKVIFHKKLGAAAPVLPNAAPG
jgi:GNAT superfamily N-acetyltransferase